jgi:epoxide hydrolase 4
LGRDLEIEHRTLALPGFRAHVAMAGAGPPLVLVHGWPEFWGTWRPVMARLADRYRLIVPDLRGFGLSENPHPEPFDGVGADRHADDLVALLDALGIAAAGFVGHDVGAYVLQSVGLRHPSRARGLMFFNCPTHGVGARWRDATQIPEIWYQTFHQQPFAASLVGASRETCRAYLRHFLTHWTHRKDTFDDVLEEWVDVFLRPGVLQGGFNWYLSARAGRLAVMAGTAPKPPKIAVPSRVLWGRHDPILKSVWADVLPDYFEDIEIGFAEGSGHFVHREEPDLAAAAIGDFFVRLET